MSVTGIYWPYALHEVANADMFEESPQYALPWTEWEIAMSIMSNGGTLGSSGLSPMTVTSEACNSTDRIPRDSLNTPLIRTLDPTVALSSILSQKEVRFRRATGNDLQMLPCRPVVDIEKGRILRLPLTFDPSSDSIVPPKMILRQKSPDCC